MKISRLPRIKNEFSLHDEYNPDLCPDENRNGISRHDKCGIMRTIDCCRSERNCDIIECSKCGLQRSITCDFDEEFD